MYGAIDKFLKCKSLHYDGAVAHDLVEPPTAR